MNTEKAPKIILGDEDELLYYPEILEDEASIEIVDKLFVIGKHLDFYQGRVDTESKKIKAELKKNRVIHLYDLIELRYFNPETSIEVKIVKQEEEELHDYSQNRIIITADSSLSRSDNEILPESFVTNLDLLAKSKNGLNSGHILNLIGIPDELEGERIFQTLGRTFEELRDVGRAYVRALKEGDKQKIKTTDNIRNIILPRRLRNLRENYGVLISFNEPNQMFKFFIGNKTNMIFEKEYWGRVDYLVEASGGVDWTEE